MSKVLLGQDFLGQDLYEGDEVVFSNERVGSLFRGTIYGTSYKGTVDIMLPVGRMNDVSKKTNNVVKISKILAPRTFISRMFQR